MRSRTEATSGTTTRLAGCASSVTRTSGASAEVAAVLLETTILIDLLRRRPGAAARLRSLREAGDSAYACAINVEEIVRGLRSGEDEAARRLFAELRIVPLGADEGRRTGAWCRRLESLGGGRTLTQADCLIAAAALSIGGRLATGNPKDFPIPRSRSSTRLPASSRRPLGPRAAPRDGRDGADPRSGGGGI